MFFALLPFLSFNAFHTQSAMHLHCFVSQLRGGTVTSETLLLNIIDSVHEFSYHIVRRAGRTGMKSSNAGQIHSDRKITGRRGTQRHCRLSASQLKWLCDHAFLTILSKKCRRKKHYRKTVLSLRLRLTSREMKPLTKIMEPVTDLSLSKFVTEVIW